MKKNGNFWMAGFIRSTLFACSLGAVLVSVSGNLLFILITGSSAAVGIGIGSLVGRLQKK